MSTLEERRAQIFSMAKHRHASVEEAVGGIVGNIEVIGEAVKNNDGDKAGEHALYALTHFAVLLGNIAGALNESAAAAQELALLASEGFRLDQEEIAKTKEQIVKDGRDYFGKRRN